MSKTQVATTKMSSKGQVVIPEEIRYFLGIKAGALFVAIGHDDTVILKMISEPPVSKFKGLLDQAEKAARKAGLKKTDVKNAIKDVRKGK